MDLEKLLKERDSLRQEIESIRKQNESALLYIKGFLSKISEYVSFCKSNDVCSHVFHEIDGERYLIECSGTKFAIRLYSAKGDCRRCYVERDDMRITYCLVGDSPTLATITGSDGTLTENAKWFSRNIETIIGLVDHDLEDCVKKQIEDAKKLLGR